MEQWKIKFQALKTVDYVGVESYLCKNLFLTYFITSYSHPKQHLAWLASRLCCSLVLKPLKDNAIWYMSNLLQPPYNDTTS